MNDFEAGSSPDDEEFGDPAALAEGDEVVRQFVEHWGVMARSWGINATMGELFALLYITGTDWTADALRQWLRISRGNVSMNLRELISWGVVHKTHRQGHRREFYRAEADVWTLFRRILTERKRRELDPTLVVLERTVRMIEADPAELPLQERVVALRQFFGRIDALASRLLLLQRDDLEDLQHLLGLEQPDSSTARRMKSGKIFDLPFPRGESGPTTISRGRAIARPHESRAYDPAGCPRNLGGRRGQLTLGVRACRDCSSTGDATRPHGGSHPRSCIHRRLSGRVRRP